MKLSHLALPVSDPQRAWAFYRDVLEVEGQAREVEDGLLITARDGFVLAFIEGEPTPGDGRLHFGFSRESGDEVRDVRARLQTAGLRETDWIEMDGFVSMKFHDPDGYVVEVFWEQT
jgi:catechol 2,3-dioxygenase-like lactoylglutathione lyase family enzyme